MSDMKQEDARTAPVGVWQVLESLRGEELTKWRLAELDNVSSVEMRNLDVLPYPYGWFMACYSDELAIGEVKPLQYFGRDLVLWRGEDGQPRLIDAYCRHLGAHMGYGGKVEGNNLVCPFHAWAYNEQGCVTDVPYAKRLPPSATRPPATQYKTCEENKAVWFWYHPYDEAPKWEVDRFDEIFNEDWTEFDKHEWIVRGPIQNLAENGVDAAHFKYVHGTATFPDYQMSFDGHKRTATVEAKMGTPKGEIDGKISYGTVGPGQSWTKFSGISETLLISGVTPIAPDRIHIRFAFTQPKEEADGPMQGLAKALKKDICKQLDQDKVVWDRQKYLNRPIICDGDGPIPAFRSYFSQFYAEWEKEGKKTITSLDVDKKSD